MAKSKRKKAKPKKPSALFARLAQEQPPAPAGRLPPMSEVLMAFAQPLTQNLPPDAAWEPRLRFAVHVWNRCVEAERAAAGFVVENPTPPINWDAALANEQLTDETIARFQEMEQFLIRRKRRVFPRDQRLIVDAKVWEEGGQIRVSALSHITNEQLAERGVDSTILGRQEGPMHPRADFMIGE